MNYFVYILENNVGRHYVGITTDPTRRLAEHNTGNTKSTRPFGPWRTIYTEEFQTRSEACKREWHLKHTTGRKEKEAIIKQYGRHPGP